MVVLPEPVGPVTRISPFGQVIHFSKRSRSLAVKPRSWRLVISTLGSKTRTTIFSPNAVAMLDTRSSTSRSARWVLIRPSCGRRRSAMFMPASTLMRETTAPCTESGSVSMSCRMPSIRNRITASLARGSRWMSEARCSKA